MYTAEALHDTKLSEVKQIAAELGITTVEDNRRKHLWVSAILSAQGVDPLPLLELVGTAPAFPSPVTSPQPPVTTPEPDEDDDDDQDETWEEELEDEDSEEDYPEEDFFSEPDDSFFYKDWMVLVDGGDISYQDPKTQEWDNWVYDSHFDEAIRELERHIDRIEFDRTIPPGQLELDLFPTSDVQSANVSDTWEVPPSLMAEFREACRAIASPGAATELSAIDPTPGAATERYQLFTSIDAIEQSAIDPTPGAATELSANIEDKRVFSYFRQDCVPIAAKHTGFKIGDRVLHWGLRECRVIDRRLTKLTVITQSPYWKKYVDNHPAQYPKDFYWQYRLKYKNGKILWTDYWTVRRIAFGVEPVAARSPPGRVPR